MTTLLVVGSAPCLFDDLTQARLLFWDHEVMLVNGACIAVEHAEHILAGHTNLAQEFHAARKNAFPNAAPWRVHANWNFPRKGIPKKDFPCVTDWWGPEMSSGATSAGKAALIGLAMNFERVVLCGCPMNGGGYFKGEQASSRKDSACQRVGDPKMQDRKIICRYRKRMAELAANEFKGRVLSMSGYTRELLGAPQEGMQ